MRGADGGPWRRLCALPALWVGLLYDEGALDAAWDLVKDWSQEQRALLRAEVPRTGLKTPVGKRSMQEVALQVLEIAREGLDRRGRTDTFGESEAHFLNALWTIAESGETPADELLRRFHGDWQGVIDPIFRESAY